MNARGGCRTFLEFDVTEPEKEKPDRKELDKAIENAFATMRSGRMSRRNLFLIIVLLAGVFALRELGLLGEVDSGGYQIPAVNVVEFGQILSAAPLLPVIGDPDHPVKVVEFTEYQCGHCRAMARILDEIADEGHASIVVIELPTRDSESVIAARFALAAAQQDRYRPYHRALMYSTIPYTDTALGELGENLGLDRHQLLADAYSDEVTQVLAYNQVVAETLGVAGTPSFVIGDQLLAGSVDKASLIGLIAGRSIDNAYEE